MPRQPLTIASMRLSFSGARLSRSRAEQIARGALSRVSLALESGDIVPQRGAVGRLEAPVVEMNLSNAADQTVAARSAAAILEALKRARLG